MQLDNPISFTESAKTHVQTFITDAASALRLGVKKTGCSGYAYLVDVVEKPRENDLSYSIDGIAVFIAADSIAIVRGTQIDFVDKGTGQKQLAFNNPNAEDFCGCGESFTLKDEKQGD